MDGHRSKAALAAEAWRRLFGFFMSTRPQRDLVLERLGLTPNDAKALWSLDQGHGRTMSSLAAEWLCDASNATWMVDRLERRGLAERQTNPTDRRVKLVMLTPLGVETKAELDRGMNEPPPELLTLDRADLEALLAATTKLPVDGSSTHGPASA
ncbi:MAG: MarR family winged helix-turn-helix transcriptional regulator [Dehalococcoidia bacterium]